mgnify:FL=1
MKTIKNIIITFTALASFAPAMAQKYVGGDISMLPYYEQERATYYDHNGKSISNVLSFFKDEGWNAMRVRLFVNPTKHTTNSSAPYSWSTDNNVCQNIEWVKSLGKRIKAAGFQFMLDIHYSDTWADPGKQWTPEAWKDADDTALGDSVYNYTVRVLKALTAAGAEPDFVQTGNEISYGMLWGQPNGTLKQCWPSSSTANWTRFTNLLSKATQAVRATAPSAKIILHVERVSSNTSLQADNANYAALTNFYQKMTAAGIDYDIIGLSYYPYFHGAMSELEGAISKLEASYPSKKIMLVETGYPYAWAVSNDFDYTGTFAYSNDGQKAYTDSLVTMLNKHNNVNGLFWWWPEYNAKGTSLGGWYNAPLFDSRTGCATSALAEMKKFLSTTNGISTIKKTDSRAEDDNYYNLSGQRISKPAKGVYIHRGHIINT